ARSYAMYCSDWDTRREWSCLSCLWWGFCRRECNEGWDCRAYSWTRRAWCCYSTPTSTETSTSCRGRPYCDDDSVAHECLKSGKLVRNLTDAGRQEQKSIIPGFIAQRGSFPLNDGTGQRDGDAWNDGSRCITDASVDRTGCNLSD